MQQTAEAFRVLMWRLARVSGVEISTYCVMGNHFHLLVRVPERERLLKRPVRTRPPVARTRDCVPG